MKQDSLEVLFQRYPLGIQFCIAFGLSQVSTQVMLRQNRCSSESLERKMIISNFGCKLCYMQCSHISHQTGATSLTLSENTVVLTPVSIATRNIHVPNIQTPVFHGRVSKFIRGMRTRMHPRKFATGTRGNVGSIILPENKNELDFCKELSSIKPLRVSITRCCLSPL